MTSIEKYKIEDIQKKNPLFSAIRATVETAFYANNVEKIETVAEAYALAKETKGTIVTDLPIHEPEVHGFPENSKVLVFNDGEVVGRTSAARKIIGQPGVDTAYLHVWFVKLCSVSVRKKFIQLKFTSAWILSSCLKVTSCYPQLMPIPS